VEEKMQIQIIQKNNRKIPRFFGNSLEFGMPKMEPDPRPPPVSETDTIRCTSNVNKVQAHSAHLFVRAVRLSPHPANCYSRKRFLFLKMKILLQMLTLLKPFSKVLHYIITDTI
jgi:hypothetical protein